MGMNIEKEYIQEISNPGTLRVVAEGAFPSSDIQTCTIFKRCFLFNILRCYFYDN